MKQYLNSEQTAKLIELGFKKPKSKIEMQLCNIKGQPMRAVTIVENYSIGELIEMLPPRTHSGGFDWDLDINHDYKFERWLCFFNPENQIGIATELVDALYNLIIKLKEKGVI